MMYHDPSPMRGLTYRVPLQTIQAWMYSPEKTSQSYQIAWVVAGPLGGSDREHRAHHHGDNRHGPTLW